MKFWLHYNKPASLSAGENRLSIHFNDTCHIIKGVDCHVRITSRNRKRQPRCVMAGEAAKIIIRPDGVAVIKGA
jgi:uncharacterized cupin superfamily protein